MQHQEETWRKRL